MPFDSAPQAQPATVSETAQVLLGAAAIVRERWRQKSTGKDRGRRCALGALMEASGPSGRGLVRATIFLQRAIDGSIIVNWGSSIMNWNDHPGRTAEEVAQALERAADLAKTADAIRA